MSTRINRVKKVPFMFYKNRRNEKKSLIEDTVVEFFALLEEALPAGSYLTSLSPVGEGDGRIEARFKVVTGGLSELMSLMTKLESLKFKNLAIKGETQMGGQLVSEIGLTYERAH